MLASKAMGIILSNLTSDIAEQFKDKVTPQTLLEAVVSHYRPDVNQEVDRLEKDLMKLTYDGSDPVMWSGNIRGLIAKLTAKNVAPTKGLLEA